MSIKATSSFGLRASMTAVAVMLALGTVSAHAQISDDVVRIGTMADLSGPYSGNGGPGSGTRERAGPDRCAARLRSACVR